MSKKRILFVLTTNIMYGTERFVVDIAKALPKDKYEVFIAIPEEGPVSDILKKYSLNEIIYSNKRIGKFTFRGIKNLYKLSKKYKFDIIHSSCGIVPTIIGYFLGVKKRVETRHGILYTELQLNNLSIYRFLVEYIKHILLTQIIAMSENDKTKMIKYFKYKKNKIFTIYDGIDIENIRKYSNSNDDISNSFVKICNIGRYSFQKGQDILINSMKLVIEQRKDVRLAIIGSGEDKKYLEDMIVENKLSDFVILENYRKDILSYMKSFDILVLTSRFEGIPAVILEAMALGVPIISSNVGGIPNIIRDGENGLLTNPDKPEETASAILKLINDKELYSKIKKNALNDICNYSFDKTVKNYEMVFNI